MLYLRHYEQKRIVLKIGGYYALSFQQVQGIYL